MRCRECESLLWVYLDDELPEPERQAVAVHLAGCSRCSLAYEQLRSFPLRANQLQTVAPPPDFTARLMQRIAPLPPPTELAARQERARSGPFSGPIGLVVALSAAAATITIGLLGTSALVLFNERPPVSTDTDTLATANDIAAWMPTAIWQHLNWPVVLTLLGMLAVLALIWFRVAMPRHWSAPTYGITATPRRRNR